MLSCRLAVTCPKTFDEDGLLVGPVIYSAHLPTYLCPVALLPWCPCAHVPLPLCLRESSCFFVGLRVSSCMCAHVHACPRVHGCTSRPILFFWKASGPYKHLGKDLWYRWLSRLNTHLASLASPIKLKLPASAKTVSASASCLLRHVCYVTSAASHLPCHVCCVTSVASRLLCHVCCAMSSASRLLRHVYCVTSAASGLLRRVGCLTSAA
jgi:hypothetical protein